MRSERPLTILYPPRIHDVSGFTFSPSRHLAEKYRVEYAYAMPATAINPTPELFEIEAVSPEGSEPENESYVIRMRLNGAYEVRSFLSDHGVDEKRIVFAIEELGHSRQVQVRNEPQKRRAA